MATAESAYELGKAIRAGREARGLTQGQLAAQAEVGRQWLVGFELGDKRSAPLDMVLRLLTVLDLEVTLVPRRPRPPLTDIDLDALIARTRDR